MNLFRQHHDRSEKRTHLVQWVLCLSLGVVAFTVTSAHAQSARLGGFVTDEKSGQALELVNVSLENEQGVLRGAVTNADGLYQIPRISPGRYVLRASYIGYETYTDTVDLEPGEVSTRNIVLVADRAGLDEVVVETERTSGAARVTAGQQTIRPREIEMIPAPDVTGDLASYLTTMPSVVTTGDRSGQFFIRGGEPSQNLVQLDGMMVYQPFHILGFYSAFPSDIINRADVYAGGYGSRFGERVSSVVDVSAREGNKRRFGGVASISPFIGTLLLEGPLVPNRISFLASVRQSLVEQGAERIVSDRLPFDFGDAFAKIHAEVSPRSRLSATALQTHDRGTLHEEIGLQEPDEIRWWNKAAGLRYLMLPRLLPVSAEFRLAYSSFGSEFGPSEEALRSTDISNVLIALDATFHGARTDVDAGWSLRMINSDSELGGIFQNAEIKKAAINHLGFYVEPEFTFGALRVRPGLRMEFYAIQFDPVLEPRLRLVWERGVHQVSGAAGLYHQEIVGLVDQRDAASVFTTWTNVPRFDPRLAENFGGKVPRAAHAILGYRGTPTHWLEFSVEGFFKKLDNLYVAQWTPYPHMTTQLQPATGRALGFDARVELRRSRLYGAVTYGLSSTLYDAQQAELPLWFGEESIRYRPPHDRRHQVNALLSLELYGFDLSARWAFGSGLPFSRPEGFDGFVAVNDVDIRPETLRWRRAIYGRPFNAVLPTYHRLDVSLERTFTLNRFQFTVMGSLINAYDRRNIFYVDVFTLQRADQLPFLPSVGLKVDTNGN